MAMRSCIRLLVVALLMLPTRALAQEATLTGVVTDASGGVLPGVTVRAVHEARRKVELVVDLARRVDGDHVRMIDRGGELCLALEALAEARIAGAIVRDQLDRDRASQAAIGRLIDDAHAAATEQPLDPPFAEIGTGGQFPHAKSLAESREMVRR